MVESFTSVISWFTGIFQNLISWFLDTSSITKILLFIAPVFVIAGLSVFFDFVVPMFSDMPQWKINKQVAVMSPKNQINLKPNLHLIPRRAYKLIHRKFYSRLGDKIQTFKGSDIKSFKSDKLQGFNTKEIRGFKSSVLKNFRSDFKTGELRSFKSNTIQSFKPEDIKSFGVRDIKPIKVSEIRPVSVSSRIISGSTDKIKISAVNNLRIASPAFKINTSHNLTKLGIASVVNARRTMSGGHDLVVDEDTGEVSAPSEL